MPESTEEETPGSRIQLRWLKTGQAGLEAMVQAIDGARHSVKLQTYIFSDSEIAQRILAALVGAAERGVRVRVLIDAVGSFSLPAAFFDELTGRGGEYRVFNPLHPRRFLYRNHRKSLICDGETAIVGGFNIAQEYAGDGVVHGWRDLGLELRAPLVVALEQSFDSLYARASLKPRHFAWLRRARESDRIKALPGELLLSGPGRRPNPLKRSLLRDISRADRVRIITPYFLPTWGLRRRLMKRARLGVHVQLLLPALSDVPLAQAAGRLLYGRLLRAGVDIREYQPQILHSKLLILDDAVYVGSANFNTRSLHIDYELMVRIENTPLRVEADAIFDDCLTHSQAISLDAWRQQRGLWDRLVQRFAYFLMARVDPLVAGWLWKGRR